MHPAKRIVRHRVRRVARLVGAVAAMVLGAVYALALPGAFAVQAEAPYWIVRTWGGCLMLGGALVVVAWVSRVLIIERMGLTFLITGLGALLLAQAGVTVQGGIHPGEVAGSALVLFFLSYLVARWQDVRDDERAAQDAIREVEEVRGEP